MRTVNFNTILERHRDEVENKDYVNVILDLLLQDGVDAVAEFKNSLIILGADLKPYNDAILKIIKDIASA